MKKHLATIRNLGNSLKNHLKHNLTKSMATQKILVIVAISLIVISLVSIFIYKSNKKTDKVWDVTQRPIDFNHPDALDPRANHVTAKEREDVYNAFVRGYDLIKAGDVSGVREWFKAIAASEEERKQVMQMKDADLLNLINRLAVISIKPDARYMLAPDALWIKEGNTMTVTYTDASGSRVTKRSIFSNGRWY